MESPEFWGDQRSAQKTIDQLKIVRAQIEPLELVMRKFEDATVGYEMAKEGNDAELLAEVDESIHQMVADMDKVEAQSLLSEKHDHRNCFITIQAGVGGTEANDWAEMLERMYLYWWNTMGFKVEEMHRLPGSEVGPIASSSKNWSSPALSPVLSEIWAASQRL